MPGKPEAVLVIGLRETENETELVRALGYRVLYFNSIVSLDDALRVDVPALLASTSTLPSAATAAWTSLVTPGSRLTSQARPLTWPCWLRPATAWSTSAASRPQRKTRQPSSRKRRAAASPIPLLPPVIRTPRPVSPRMCHAPDDRRLAADRTSQ